MILLLCATDLLCSGVYAALQTQVRNDLGPELIWVDVNKTW